MKNYAWGKPDEKLITSNGKVMCPRCMKYPAIIHDQYGVLPCDNCKARSEGFTNKSRKYWQPDYIKKQQEKFHPDFVQPHITQNGKLAVNPEFVKLYPDKARTFYTPEEMKQAGMPKLVEYSKTLENKEKIQKQKIEEYKAKVIEYRQTGNREQLKDFLKNL